MHTDATTANNVGPNATSTFSIMHLNCPPHPPPQKKKICITFVFYFSWVLQPSQEKLKTISMQNFGVQIKPGFHMIVTIAMIAAIAELFSLSDRSNRSHHIETGLKEGKCGSCVWVFKRTRAERERGMIGRKITLFCLLFWPNKRS